MNKVSIYIAGLLFSLAERNFNKALAEILKDRIPNCIVSLPQEHAKTITNKMPFVELMFNYCLKAIDDSDMVVAVLDGPDVDAGTCVEIGYAYAHKKPVIGVRTDFRASEDRGVNLMVSGACSNLIWLPSSIVDEDVVYNEVVGAIQKLLSSRLTKPRE